MSNSSKTRPAKSSGRAHPLPPFIPVYDSIAAQLSPTRALVLSAVLRYTHFYNGVCTASVRNISGRLHLNVSTVHQHLKALIAAGYLEDLTPGRRYAPHTYRDTGKAARAPEASETGAGEEGQNTGVYESNTSVYKPNTSVYNSNGSVWNSALNRESIDNKETIKERTAPSRSATMELLPEMRLFREVAGFLPPKQIHEDVTDSIRRIGKRLGRTPTPDDLKPFLKAWAGRGWKLTNLGWLYEWATSGEIPAKGATEAAASQPQRPPRPQHTPEQLAVLARIQAERRAHPELYGP